MAERTRERTQNIFRVVKNGDNPYVQIDKALINNKKLSTDARFLLIYLLSKPNDWTARNEDLLEHTGWSVYRLRRAIAECEAAGYMVRQRVHVNGRFAWETKIYEKPNAQRVGGGAEPELDNEADVASGNGERLADVRNTMRCFSKHCNSAHILKNDLTKNDLNSSETIVSELYSADAIAPALCACAQGAVDSDSSGDSLTNSTGADNTLHNTAEGQGDKGAKDSGNTRHTHIRPRVLGVVGGVEVCVPEEVLPFSDPPEAEDEAESGASVAGGANAAFERRRMFAVLAKVCKLDPSVNRGMLNRTVKRYMAAGWDAGDIERLFGEGGWWYVRGPFADRGDPPSVGHISKYMLQALESERKASARKANVSDANMSKGKVMERPAVRVKIGARWG